MSVHLKVERKKPMPPEETLSAKELPQTEPVEEKVVTMIPFGTTCDSGQQPRAIQTIHGFLQSAPGIDRGRMALDIALFVLPRRMDSTTGQRFWEVEQHGGVFFSEASEIPNEKTILVRFGAHEPFYIGAHAPAWWVESVFHELTSIYAARGVAEPVRKI